MNWTSPAKEAGKRDRKRVNQFVRVAVIAEITRSERLERGPIFIPAI